MKEVLNPRRLWLLIRNDVVADYRILLLASGALAVLMLLFSATRIARFDPSDFYYARWYLAMLFVWGPIVASSSFKELHDKTKNEAYLLLPASALEKTITRLFRTTIAFFVYLLVYLTVVSALIEAINQLWFGRHNAVFNPLNLPANISAWVVVGNFIVATSLYFLGAAWFRKTHFVKTAVALTVIPFALILFAVFLASILFRGSYSFALQQDAAYAYYLAHKTLAQGLLVALKALYFFVLPVFCWVVAWLRVVETQVSDGV